MSDKNTGPEMDFIRTLEYNYAKLTNKEMVNLLWREIIKGERCASHLDQLIEYSFHYPVDTEAYLEELNLKFDDLQKEELRTIDGRLKAYLITFLYYCTKREDNRVPMKTTVLASCLYLKLVMISGIGKIFFERNMYKVQLVTCVHIIPDNTVSSSAKIYLIKLIKKNCLRQPLEPYLLKGTANTLSGIILMECTESIKDIRKVAPVPLYAINAIREIVFREEDGARLKCILECLFRCLRRCVEGNVSNRRAAIDIMIVFIRDVLRHELDDIKFQHFMDAFCATWGFEDFDSYQDAVVIMNLLKIQYYKELIRRMVLYTQSQAHKRYQLNIMHLLLEIAKNLPPFSISKVEVLYSCAIRNILYQFVDRNRSTSDRSIQLIAELCMLKNNPMLEITFNHFECSGKFVNISVEALFLAFMNIADEKWGVTPRNHNLLIVFAKFVSYTRSMNVELVEKTLMRICQDGTPSTLKMILPLLHELFCVMAQKEEQPIAEAVLRIIFMNAMHQDVSSRDYVDHIYQSMLKPSIIDGVTYSQNLYCNIFLSSRFEYDILFAKCSDRIGEQDVRAAISNLDYGEPGSAILICSLLEHCTYTEQKVLAAYIIEHFTSLSGYASVGFACAALGKILTNRRATHMDYPQLDVIQTLIMDALFQQTLPVPSIRSAYDLFLRIRGILKLPKDVEKLDRLLRVTSERAYRRLHLREPGDNSVLMYLNEVCLMLGRLPAQDILILIESYMENPTTISVLTTFMPDVYIQLLTLFTTIGMMNKKKAPLALEYLHGNLNNDEKIIRVLAFKLLFSLCQEITHEYETLIRYSFKEMVNGDPCLIRICAVALEELIHDDFIKLSAEDFFRFVYILGCNDLKIFMRDVLMKRFILSNQNDIAKFYVQSIVYMNNCTKLPNYPIPSQFLDDLTKITLKINRPKEMLLILFEKLPIRRKFNIISEICCVLEDLVDGHCKIDDSFFNVVVQFLATIKFMKTNSFEPPEIHYYYEMSKQVERQIVGHDPTCNAQSYYMEYETEIKRCTLVLLKLLFYENEQLAVRIQIQLFDTIMHWIDFVKAEIIHYVHVERGRDYDPYFSKLVQYYKRNKGRLEIDSLLSGVDEDSKLNIVVIVPGYLFKRLLLPFGLN